MSFVIGSPTRLLVRLSLLAESLLYTTVVCHYKGTVSEELEKHCILWKMIWNNICMWDIKYGSPSIGCMQMYSEFTSFVSVYHACRIAEPLACRAWGMSGSKLLFGCMGKPLWILHPFLGKNHADFQSKILSFIAVAILNFKLKDLVISFVLQLVYALLYVRCYMVSFCLFVFLPWSAQCNNKFQPQRGSKHCWSNPETAAGC